MLVGISRRHSCFSSSLSLIFVFDVILKTVCPSHYHRTTVERRIWRKKPRGSRIVEMYGGSTTVDARRIGQKDPFGRVLRSRRLWIPSCTRCCGGVTLLLLHQRLGCCCVAFLLLSLLFEGIYRTSGLVVTKSVLLVKQRKETTKRFHF